ncbi:MAG: bifunctional oligoribonuclease/PAP phosphatase NrnA [Spirochaetaceae bacterium]|jgi:phosphoesterase RecJ-like protein|nr:bifunctional oligoribonuclease/PAP phosphatase NrnA [Spirochaetaceae bacterium]
MIPVPPQLLTFIHEGNRFLIAGHREPDGDCVGSQLALASALGRLGKETVLCSAGPFRRTEILPWKDRFAAQVPDSLRAGARVIITDCGALERTGDLRPFLEGLPLAVIDHHAVSPEDPGSGAVLFLDPGAPAAAVMVLSLIEALGLSPSPEEAEAIFFGLCTDTGFFRHLDSRGAGAFRHAAALVEAGADPKRTYHAMYGGKSLGARQLAGIVLARAESHYGGRLIVSWENYGETREYGAGGRDSDAVYQLLMSVGGVEAVAVIRQESPEKCAIGLRSRDRVDVGQVARHFGGGGHKNAAGASVPGTIPEILSQTIDAFKEELL